MQYYGYRTQNTNVYIKFLLLKCDFKYSYAVDRYFVFNDEQDPVKNQV